MYGPSNDNNRDNDNDNFIANKQIRETFIETNAITGLFFEKNIC